MDPHDYEAWRGSGIAGTMTAFWSAVKAATMYRHGVRNMFITGISPLLLSDMGGGFNISENISFKPRFATVCGLTTDDVEDTLRLFCKGDEEKVQKHFAELEKYANGYHFSNIKSGPKVFNPYTVMWYLNVISLRHRTPLLINVPNSEASENMLMRFAGAPAAIHDIQHALHKDGDVYRKFKYDTIIANFKLEELVSCTCVDGLLFLTLSFCLVHSGHWRRRSRCMALSYDLRGRPHLRFGATG